MKNFQNDAFMKLESCAESIKKKTKKPKTHIEIMFIYVGQLIEKWGCYAGALAL